MSAAQYRILSPDGGERAAGAADVQVTGGALVVAPSGDAPLRVPFGQIAAVSEPQPYVVLVTLADGNAIELSRLGVMRTQLLAELRDGRGDDAAAAARALGQATVFSGLAGGEPAELRVYEDALLVSRAAGSERISFSFVSSVDVTDYVITIEVAGRAPLTLTRLGRQTSELATLAADRLREARLRTSAFLASLLPGLDPMALREAAGLFRDGVAVPVTRLDAVHPDLASTLVEIAVLPERRDAVADLGRRTELAIGFRQLASVRKAATGVTPWRDPAVTPHIGEHESPGGLFRPGLMGVMAAGIMSQGPPMGGFGSPGGLGGPGGGFGGPGGGFGDYWAYRALGAGMNSREQRPMTERPDMTRGRLTPAADDPSALATTGEDPTVLAFALGASSDRVAFEVLNLPEPMTYVYRAGGPGGLTAINRALDEAGFQAERVADLAGQVPHDARWADATAGFLS